MALHPFFDPWLFIAELAFTIIAVAFCVAIYLRTKRSYELTKHKGILYFRDAFLFFGLSYLLRFLFSLTLLSGIAFDVFLPRGLITPLFIVLLGYFSTVAIFYLFFSSTWKRFDNQTMLILGHTLALLLAVVTFLTHSHEILLYLQAALLIVALVTVFVASKEKKRLSQTKILYLLVFILWLLDLWVIGRPRPFAGAIAFFFEILSLVVFAAIYYKVTKWVK